LCVLPWGADGLTAAQVPGSAFTLSRVAFKNNTSVYLLDGKRAAFEEVETFMQLRGVDLNNNRFLILQGEVVAISMINPMGETKNDEGLLEFLEELIGTNKYVEEIEQGKRGARGVCLRGARGVCLRGAR
jgi:structural maintenance of chromosome 4